MPRHAAWVIEQDSVSNKKKKLSKDVVLGYGYLNIRIQKNKTQQKTTEGGLDFILLFLPCFFP